MKQPQANPPRRFSLRPAMESDGATLRALLREAHLTDEGLDEGLRAGGFAVATDAERVVAGAGVEVHGASGLLRSVVVAADLRGSGMGAALVADRLAWCRARGLSSVYLLTETAADFFARRGFTHVRREEVPQEIRRSDEFSRLCPDSAAVMVRALPDA